jgi:transcriptional repressor NrdR
MQNKVIESRINQTGDIIRRRRECVSCNHRYTTYERLEVQMPMVIKKDKRREEFKREKIKEGIQKACQKRPITTAEIEKLVNQIERRVLSFNLKEIPSHVIGELVMQGLHKLDKVAYVRFASVYREFKDVDEFVDNLKDTHFDNENDDEMMFEFALSEDENNINTKDTYDKK